MLTPTVSPADQAFPAVTSPLFSQEIVTPVPSFIAGQPLARPSDVLSSVVPDAPTTNVSLQAQNLLNMPEFLVLPGRKYNIPMFDPVSPYVFEVTAWPAANRITVSRVSKGIIIPELVPGQYPQGESPVTSAVDLTTLGVTLLGRPIAPVDNVTFLAPVPFRSIASGLVITPQTTLKASDFQFMTNAAIVGISGTDTFILNENFPFSPVGYWFILDQRGGSEVDVLDYAFQGTYEPAPFLPYPSPTIAPLNIDGGTYRPQYGEAVQFSPSPPQALPPVPGSQSPGTIAQPFIASPPQANPPISTIANVANQTFDGLPLNFNIP